MKPEFKNTTKYSKEMYLKFIEFHNQKYGLKFQIYTFFFIILLIYCITINIIYSNTQAAILFIIVLGLVIYKRYFSQKEIIKEELKSEKIEKENIFHFYFYEKYFKIKSNELEDKVKYRKLYKIHQTEEYYYLYIDHTHSYIIDKKGFTKGNVEEFYQFIKSKKRTFNI